MADTVYKKIILKKIAREYKKAYYYRPPRGKRCEFCKKELEDDEKHVECSGDEGCCPTLVCIKCAIEEGHVEESGSYYCSDECYNEEEDEEEEEEEEEDDSDKCPFPECEKILNIGESIRYKRNYINCHGCDKPYCEDHLTFTYENAKELKLHGTFEEDNPSYYDTEYYCSQKCWEKYWEDRPDALYYDAEEGDWSYRKKM